MLRRYIGGGTEVGWMRCGAGRLSLARRTVWPGRIRERVDAAASPPTCQELANAPPGSLRWLCPVVNRRF